MQVFAQKKKVLRFNLSQECEKKKIAQRTYFLNNNSFWFHLKKKKSASLI